MITRLFLLCLLAVSSVSALRQLRDPVAHASRTHKIQKRDAEDGATNNKFKTAYYDAKIDQFSFSDYATYQMKYLYNMDNYKPNGNIFFYTGNEGDVEGFAEATGMMFDLAPMFNAAIVFAEHRYYGTSMPFKNSSYTNLQNLGYLTSQQALADYAQFLTDLLDQNNTKLEIGPFPSNTKIIAFGGSYGGMLSAWMRIKYPHLIAGAWASSAPLVYFHGAGVSEGIFDHITTNTYQISGCNNVIIQQTWDAVKNLSQTDNGRATLNNIYHLNPPLNSSDQYQYLNDFIREAIEYMAMTDYPYPTSFLQPMPGSPVVQACKYLNVTGTSFDDVDIVTRMAGAIGIYYNYTQNVKEYCIFPSVCGDPGTAGLGDASALGWPYQECSEIVMDMCAMGPPYDFFWNECGDDNIANLAQGCLEFFGNLNWTTQYWNIDSVRTIYGFDLSGASNIILPQGSLDPWSGGGYQRTSKGIDQNRGIYAFTIPGSAHHLDLRTPNTCDPNTVKNARYQIVEILRYFTGSRASPPIMTDLPTYVANTLPDNQCIDVNNGYPWGQVTPTSPVVVTQSSTGATQASTVATDTTTKKSTSTLPILFGMMLTSFIHFVKL